MATKNTTKPVPPTSSQSNTTDLEAKITELNEEIVALRANVFTLRDELHTLRNSRVVGRIIKTRDKVGNPATIARRAVHKTRRSVARYVPDQIRLPLMKKLRSTRATLRQKREQFKVRDITVETIQNVRWPVSRPLVSVVIPYFNMAATINETIGSLVNQTFTNFEVIIVDDGSTDKNSIVALKELKASPLRLQKLSQKNQGVAAARNYGISKAKGKYIICLDADDMLEPTFIEKATLVLETDPDISVVTTNQDMFGVITELFEKKPYEPLHLIHDNMVIVAAQFRKEAWEVAGGYKSGIGYEDWDFWLTLSEHGFWGKLIPEALFKYRTSMQSRYVGDKDVHWDHMKAIRHNHKNYRPTIKRLMAERLNVDHLTEPETAFINLADTKNYQKSTTKRPKVLIAIPWMTFGGAETLIYNFCREIKDSYNLSFVTGLKSKNEWEYKFKEITPNIYHLANLFDDQRLYIEFISNYIKTRDVDVLHLIHCGFVFDMLPEIKRRHPNLKVIVTMFNDRVPDYVKGVIDTQIYLDNLTTDNQKVAVSFKKKLTSALKVEVIPNGIDCYKEFNGSLYKRDEMRETLGLSKNDLAVFFVGRLSEEKNPDVFLSAASKILGTKQGRNIHFYMIGDGPMRAEIDKQLHAIGSKHLHYLGYQARVAPYLSAADVFVLPSSIEGFPLSILEAMAMNLVIVASDVGAVSEVVVPNENGYILTPGSVEDIVRAVTQIDKNRELMHNMKQQSRKRVEGIYSNKVLGANYEKLYRSVLK